MRYKPLIFPAILCALLLLCGLTFAGSAALEEPKADALCTAGPENFPEQARDVTVAEDGTVYPIDIPTLAELQESGYPINQNGETYGGRPRGLDDELEDPDLVLAQNRDGVVGYIRPSEDPNEEVSNPEEALAYMEYIKENPYCPTLYLEDGITIVGKFHCTDCACSGG